MMKRLAFIVAILLLAFTIVKPSLALDLPDPIGHVNDFGQMFSNDFVQEWETKLRDFEEETTAEIAVVTITTFGESTIEEYAVLLFEKWGIGKKEEDNGLLVLIAKEDRKMRIEVGYGLEPVITDGRAGRVIREQMTPAFKESDFEGGVAAATNKLMDYIRSGEPPVEETTTPSGGDKAFGVIMGAVFLIYMAAFLGRSKRIWPGGLIGALLGLMLAPLIGILLLGLWGLFLDWLLSRNYKQLKRKRKPTSFWKSWGGFSSGGSSRSGGFGGFSGGSSGGGGASGGW